MGVAGVMTKTSGQAPSGLLRKVASRRAARNLLLAVLPVAFESSDVTEFVALLLDISFSHLEICAVVVLPITELRL